MIPWRRPPPGTVPDMLARAMRIAWLGAVALFVVIWVSRLHIWFLEAWLPLVMMLLSLAAFNKVPGGFRLTHHIFVPLLFLGTIAGAMAFAFYGGDQGGIGSYLLLYYSGVVYLCFIVALLCVLWLSGQKPWP